MRKIRPYNVCVRTPSSFGLRYHSILCFTYSSSDAEFIAERVLVPYIENELNEEVTQISVKDYDYGRAMAYHDRLWKVEGYLDNSSHQFFLQSFTDLAERPFVPFAPRIRKIENILK